MDKKNLTLKEIKLILILFVLTVIFLLLGYNVSIGYMNKVAFEKDILEIANRNEEKIFTINNITVFSSADSDAEVMPNSTLNINNLYQYTDIAIFLNSAQEELTYKNTLKELYIDNIKFVTTPKEGIPSLYYKNIQNFATSKFLDENKIEDKLQFNISSEDTADLNTPTLYNNCANPITLSYLNNNIKTNYTLPDAFTQIAYDGSLLKRCNVTLSSIASSISFDIHITNNLDQQFVCPIYLEIPIDAKDGTSIYDGKVLLKNNTNYIFYRCN